MSLRNVLASAFRSILRARKLNAQNDDDDVYTHYVKCAICMNCRPIKCLINYSIVNETELYAQENFALLRFSFYDEGATYTKVYLQVKRA